MSRAGLALAAALALVFAALPIGAAAELAVELSLGGEARAGGAWSGLARLDTRAELGLLPGLEIVLRDRVTAARGDGGESVQHVLEDLYLLLRPHAQLVAAVGRDRMREGVGHAWSPVDFLRARGPAPPGIEPPEARAEHRPGRWLARVEGRLAERSLALAWVPAADDPEPHASERWWLRYGDTALNTELALYACACGPWRVGLALTRGAGAAVTLHGEVAAAAHARLPVPRGPDRGAPGAAREVAGPPAGMPEWADGPEQRWAPVALAGASAALPGEASLLVELFVNAVGRSPGDWRRVWDALDAADKAAAGPDARARGLAARFLAQYAEQRRPGEDGRHYAFARLARGAVAGHALFSLDDASATLGLDVRWPLVARVEARLAAEAMVGPRRSEFGSLDRAGALGLVVTARF